VLPVAEPGDLVLFPSYLYHEVPRNQGDQRITIAFNAIPDSLDCWGYRINFTP
jgi:ectoine hydroxylase-related dioxygenase (phytanoyl-CoA dioxygenase family)